MTIASVTQFHVYLLWGQHLFSIDRLQLYLSTDPADDHDVVWRGPGPVLAVQLHDDPLRQPGEHRHQTSDRRVRHRLKWGSIRDNRDGHRE